MESSHSQSPLYDPSFEHDACGVAFVADLSGTPGRRVVELGLSALERLAHRGAFGADPDTGDGAGILLQLPDGLFRALAAADGVALPPPGEYGSGLFFLPTDPVSQSRARDEIARLAEEEGLLLISWREVPVALEEAGPSARLCAPSFWQAFVGRSPSLRPEDGGAPSVLERALFVLRKRLEHEVEGAYVCSLSSRTFVYKGMLASHQLARFFPDLADERAKSAIAIVHSRFSTNTFPSWPLAHPYRLVAHNGEINTVRGNRNWMRAREALLSSPSLEGEITRLLPICTPGASDSASFDEVLELLHLSGRSLPHALLMMIPEAWEKDREMDPRRRAFYEYHARLMEPWDGPAAVAFTDGRLVGAVLDRNGLRPARYWVSRDGLVVLASEVGVIDIEPENVVRRGRLSPGRMLLVDVEEHRIVEDDELKDSLAAAAPYGRWLEEGRIRLEDLPSRHMLTPRHGSVLSHQRLFGYTSEELSVVLGPMARSGTEPIGSMGSDTPVAAISSRPRLLYDYFSQLFAQVTNPPLDAIREELVTSLETAVGPEKNLLSPEAGSCRQIVLSTPVLDNESFAKLLYVNEEGETPGFSAFAIDGLYPVAAGARGLEEAVERVCAKVSEAIALGANVIVLSDRHASEELCPIPSLLLTAAVHNHLVRRRERTAAGLVIESGDAREVHHLALLLGYGASAVNPYLAFDSIAAMAEAGELGEIGPSEAIANYKKAATKGILKVMSKMGISTAASYRGAQVFEALGLSSRLVEAYFTGTPCRLEGIGIEEVAAEAAARHARAFGPTRPIAGQLELEGGGEYQWRREGELHLFNPRTVFKLQHATRAKRYDIFAEYAAAVDEQAERLATIRGLLGFKTGKDRPRPPVPIEEVEPASEIVKRFSTGAMSYGSISAEAHETLAIAMNRLGGKSNTGEGGEDPSRYLEEPNGDSRRSAIKQVASGRFGVTSEYLVNADDLQIKIAQGAKPGEGGQLPGEKVYPWIAKTRGSTPGVGLISPPPHHDIYSIEDIAQLIYDLKSANPRARVHVKLVSETGVGTVAAGVVKAHADVVLISGHDGGTGAAPLTSLKHAGAPWELGLAETQQTLVRNGLRDRVVLQTDGQLKTGRDVVIAALLGAEEFGFATAPLVVSGCVMMRVCHLDTCPVGIATQDPELRKRFSGRPEFVETFFHFVAEQVRELLAELGFRSLREAVGHTESLQARRDLPKQAKAAKLDLRPILAEPPSGEPLSCGRRQQHGLEAALDTRLVYEAAPALTRRRPVEISSAVSNTDRSVGTRLGYEVTRRFGGQGLEEGTITLRLTGSAGQSLAAFLPRGVTVELTGDANDYVAKGLSGGRVVLRPSASAPVAPEEQVIAGNVVLYGATAGEAFICGRVGERFAVRNSGASAVVEGVGDHACEYMTGGTVVIIGPTGRNFAAGMSGGIAFVLAQPEAFSRRLNTEMVDLEALDPEDVSLLGTLLSEHAGLTGSPQASRLLEEGCLAERFIKVMPREYKRALEKNAPQVSDVALVAAGG